uniref:Uncharacterized protein n=1 Tax=Romanomermis culicivorax TaxID=13658 RepID=A0A915JSQ6_ROMCU
MITKGLFYDPADPGLYFKRLIDNVDGFVSVSWDFDFETDSFSKKLPFFMGQVLLFSFTLKRATIPEKSKASAGSSSTTDPLQYKADRLYDHIRNYTQSLESTFQELAIASIALHSAVEHVGKNRWFLDRGHSHVVDIILDTMQHILYEYTGDNEKVSNAAFQYFHEFYADLEADITFDKVVKEKLISLIQNLGENWNRCEFIIRSFHYSLKAYFPVSYGSASDFEKLRISAARLVKSSNLLARMFNEKICGILDILEKNKHEQKWDENNAELTNYASNLSF